MPGVDIDELENLARDALAKGGEEAALPRVAEGADRAKSARLWQFTGLLQRALDQHAEAVRSFTTAVQLAPQDAGIANSLARVALEAGLDAVALYERARLLDPSSGPALLGLVAAKLATGRGCDAEAQLDATVERSPLWIEGHVQLAQLRSMLGKRDRAYDSIERALIAHLRQESLWAALLNLSVSQNDFAALDEISKRARRANLPDRLVVPFEAVAATELGQLDRADRLFEAMEENSRRAIGVWLVRHLLRSGRTDQAMELIDAELGGENGANFWPYASIAWRLARDPRSEWLEPTDQLVSTFDIAAIFPQLDELAAKLRSLHAVSGEYLDQSVRGGSQTDGPLLSRIDPEIRELRGAIVGAVEKYRAQLPPLDAMHPLLRERRDALIRFSGSWSVRLRGAGHHVSHVHPHGWISSALYVALPNRSEADGPHAGWLKLGSPPAELGLDLLPTRLIEPKPGQLVLFPSWMWHGTEPFAVGERLTVAFDVKRPIAPRLA